MSIIGEESAFSDSNNENEPCSSNSEESSEQSKSDQMFLVINNVNIRSELKSIFLYEMPLSPKRYIYINIT